VSTGKPEDAILISPITLKIQVDYDKEQDDIRCFADYIMELAPQNSSFFFLESVGNWKGTGRNESALCQGFAAQNTCTRHSARLKCPVF